MRFYVSLCVYFALVINFSTSFIYRSTSQISFGLSSRFAGESMEHKIKYIAKLRVSDTQTPLLEFILSHVPDIPRKTAKQWLSTGAVYVNGESQKKFDFTLYKDDSVLVRAGKISSSNVMRQQYSFGSSSVGMVYEDEDIIVIDKPYGMSTLSFQTEKQKKAVDTSTLTALSTILQYLNKRNPKKQNKLYVVHVLDKDISGLVVFAKTLTAKEALQRTWKDCGQTFTGLCSGILSPQQGTLEAYHRIVGDQVVSCNSSSAKSRNDFSMFTKTISNYRTLSTTKLNPSYISPLIPIRTRSDSHYDEGLMKLVTTSISTLEVSLVTDHKDQIRAQLAEIGCPIIGDSKYRHMPASSAPVSFSSLPQSPQPHSPSDVKPMEQFEAMGQQQPQLKEHLQQQQQQQQQSHKQVLSPYELLERKFSRRLHLHCSELRVTHPTNQELLTFTSPVPPGFQELLRTAYGEIGTVEYDSSSITQGNQGYLQMADSNFDSRSMVGAGAGAGVEVNDDAYDEVKSQPKQVKVVSLVDFLGTSKSSTISAPLDKSSRRPLGSNAQIQAEKGTRTARPPEIILSEIQAEKGTRTARPPERILSETRSKKVVPLRTGRLDEKTGRVKHANIPQTGGN